MLEKIIEDVSGTKRMYLRESPLVCPKLGLQLKKNNWKNESVFEWSNIEILGDNAVCAYSIITDNYHTLGVFIGEKKAIEELLKGYRVAREKYLDKRKKLEEKWKHEDDLY